MKLERYLTVTGITASAFAKAVGCHVSQISRWASGERTPGLEIALRIKKLTGGKVTPDDFAADPRP